MNFLAIDPRSSDALTVGRAGVRSCDRTRSKLAGDWRIFSAGRQAWTRWQQAWLCLEPGGWRRGFGRGHVGRPSAASVGQLLFHRTRQSTAFFRPVWRAQRVIVPPGKKYFFFPHFLVMVGGLGAR